MADAKHEPMANAPHNPHDLSEACKKSYIISTLDKFLDEYVLGSVHYL